MGTGEITLGNADGRIVDDAAATELRHELIGQIEEFRRAEALVGVVIARSLGESEGPRRAISRTRTAPLVFLAMGFVLLVMGFLLVFIALDVIGEGAAGPGVLVLLLALFELGLPLWEDETEISASPDEGWPVWELWVLTPELRGLAKHKGGREADWWARIRG